MIKVKRFKVNQWVSPEMGERQFSRVTKELHWDIKEDSERVREGGTE